MKIDWEECMDEDYEYKEEDEKPPKKVVFKLGNYRCKYCDTKIGYLPYRCKNCGYVNTVQITPREGNNKREILP